MDDLITIALNTFLITVIAASSIGIWLHLRSRRQDRQKLDQLGASTRGYIEALEQSRAFPPVTVPGLHLEHGEFAVRYDRARLAEIARARIGGGLGTRVRIGHFPIYIGGYKSVPSDELREVGPGDLVLTNRRLLFIGAHTLSIPFDKLLKCQLIDAGLVVSETKKKHPHAFVVENPGFWCFLINWFAESRFTQPKLPDGLHIAVSGNPPDLQVQVRNGVAA